MQGGIVWDSSLLAYDTIISYGADALGLNASNFGTTITKQGKLSFSWNDNSLRGISLNDSVVLFTIRLKLKRLISFKTTILFGGDPIVAEFVNESFNELIVKNDTLSINIRPGSFNYNPFADTLNLCSSKAILDAGDSLINYVWNTGSAERIITLQKSGQYSVRVTSNKGCTGSDTVNVVLTNKPIIKTNSTDQCITNNLFSFQVDDSGVSSDNLYEWDLGDSTFLKGRSVLHEYRVPGKYQAKLIGISAIGCKDTSVVPVNVRAEVASVRYETKKIIYNQSESLEARLFPEATYSWSPRYQLSDFTSRNPVFAAAVPVDYLIFIESPAACKIVDTLSVLLFEEDDIYVPDAFTPNGDGQNDYLFPFLTNNLKLGYFKIFNRWGNLLYATNSPKPGWDGTYNGVVQPSGTYVWIAEATYSDGKKIQKKGNLMLLK
jgi:gliding motility-associated-like protein